MQQEPYAIEKQESLLQPHTLGHALQAAEPIEVEAPPQLACKLAAAVSQNPAPALGTVSINCEATTPAPLEVTVKGVSFPEASAPNTVKCELSAQQHSALVAVASGLRHSQQFPLATCPEPLLHRGTAGFHDELALRIVTEEQRELAVDRHSVQVGEGIHGNKGTHHDRFKAFLPTVHDQGVAGCVAVAARA